MSQNYSQILREKIFPRVQKPARYIGGEWNMIRKDPKPIRSRVALAFPDVYEIGVSYLGYQILYELLNCDPSVYAERVFSPWPDCERLLREHAVPLCTLETGTPLAQCDLVGITLQHELSYTNVLNLLDLGGIPVTREERRETDPLVLAGGPCATNPEPLAPVFDLVVIGDGETVFPELVRRSQELQGRTRRERIQALSQIAGVYAPGRYQPVYSPEGRLERIDAESGAAMPVRRLRENPPDLPLAPIVPFLGVTHDRVTAELFRGCTRGCRFCQAGMITRPVRERGPRTVHDQLLSELKATGYEEASLTSLSSGDYTQLLPLTRNLMSAFAPQRVALSFPSLRLDSFQTELAETVREVRKTGLTFAPEAGSRRLRQVINKGLDEEQFTANLGQVFAEGWDLVKLYFMVGLPTETSEDIAAISQLVRRILAEARKANAQGRRPPHVHLGVSLFVPKPHTPFQWEPQISRQEAAARLRQLARDLPRAAGYEFNRQKEQDLDRGFLEAVLARGDRRLWPVVRRVWELGARFDSWGEEFKFNLWQQAFAECGVDPDRYALVERDESEVLPWSHLDSGVSLQYLKDERARSRRETFTPDCRQTAACNACGINAETSECPPASAPVQLPAVAENQPVSRPERELMRLRLRYQKTGDIRFVGHLDLVNVFRRASRRAGLPLHYSLGFHPQPAISFGPPLPLGYAGLKEWVDMGLDRWLEPRDAVALLNQVLPEGLQIEAGREIPLSSPALTEKINAGEYLLEFPGLADEAAWQARVADFLAREHVPGMQWSKKGNVEVNLRAAVLSLTLAQPEGKPQLRVLHSTAGVPAGSVPAGKIQALVDYFTGDPEKSWEVQVTRLASGVLYNDEVAIP